MAPSMSHMGLKQKPVPVTETNQVRIVLLQASISDWVDQYI